MVGGVKGSTRKKVGMNNRRKEGSDSRQKSPSKPLSTKNRGVAMKGSLDDYANSQNMSLLARLLEGKNATLVVLLIVVLGGGYLINENNKALLELSVSIKSLVEKERVFHEYQPRSYEPENYKK